MTRHNFAVGHATSLRAEKATPASPVPLTMCHLEPFQLSARFEKLPWAPAKCAPTNRQLVAEEQDTSLAKMLEPRDGLGTGFTVQVPALSTSDRPGMRLPMSYEPTAMQNVASGHETPLRE